MMSSWLTTPPTATWVQSHSLPDVDNGTALPSSSFTYPYDAECDYEWPDMGVKIALCFIYSFIGLVGFVGNFLVVYTILYKKGQQSVTSMLLCSLAVSDIIVVTLYLPLKLADLVTVTWFLGAFACKLVGYLTLISPSCSCCMLMVIGLERFIVILYPLRARSFITRRRAKLIVLGTWFISLIVGIPGLIFQKHTEDTLTDDFFCRKEFDGIDFFKKGYALYTLVILYIIPLCIMSFAYITVCLRLNASTKTSRGLQSMKAPSSSSYSYSKSQSAVTATGKSTNGLKASLASSAANSMDDDPFSTVSESRYDTAGGNVLSPGGSGSAVPVTRNRRQPRRPVSLKDRQQVILMLILVVVLYAITWGPLVVVSTLFAFGVLNNICWNVIFKLSAACHIMAFLNSTVNPIVYSFMSRNFRETVREALKSPCRCIWPTNVRGGRESMYYSRCSTSTMVVQQSVVRRSRSTSDGNCSPGQNIELTQYSRLPNNDATA